MLDEGKMYLLFFFSYPKQGIFLENIFPQELLRIRGNFWKLKKHTTMTNQLKSLKQGIGSKVLKIFNDLSILHDLMIL